MQGRALFVRKREKRPADIGEANNMILVRFDDARGCVGDSPVALDIGMPGPHAVDENVVKYGKKPRTQIAALAKRAPTFIGAHQRIVHEILGFLWIPRQSARVAAHWGEMAWNVKARS
jgi:hypothetical protein